MRKEINTSTTPSLWLSETQTQEFPALFEDISCQVVVIGGGITGLNCAYELNKAGYEVVLVEKDRLASKASGNTTGKLTFQHSGCYADILAGGGEEAAHALYESQLEALKRFREITKELDLECNQIETPAILYGRSEEEINGIEAERIAYRELGIPFQDVLTPFENGVGLSVPNQIGFNAAHYVYGLAEHLKDKGVRIYEHTQVLDQLEENNGINKIVANGQWTIEAEYVIVASGYPAIDDGARFDFRLVPYRSHCLAYSVPEFKEGMYISEGEPIHSVRYATEEINYLVIAGESYRVGFEKHTRSRLENLKDFARKEFGESLPTYQWSAQDYRAADQLPLIGRLSDDEKHRNVFVATGFRKWGLGFGIFSGIYLKELIQGMAENPAFKPSRKTALKTIMDQGKDKAMMVAKGMIFPTTIADSENVLPGTGGIVQGIDGKVGLFNESLEKHYLIKPTCTHIGCSLNWNELEESYDCPCHGSRFTKEGFLIEGPARKDLERVSKKMLKKDYEE